MFKNIVVGFDGSDASERALHIACDIAQKYKSDLHLVHTPQPETVAFSMGAVAGYHAVTTLPSQEEIEKSHEKILSAAIAIASTYNVPIDQQHLDLGDPAEQIVAYAGACEADLIVTGRRGLGSVKSLLQGSTSLQVNKLAKCACLSTT